MDKLLAIRVILTKGLSWSITLPPFKLQKKGKLSKDGLGLTWQSNLFGHYIMVRILVTYWRDFLGDFFWCSTAPSDPRSKRTLSVSIVQLELSGRALWKAGRVGTIRLTGNLSRQTTRTKLQNIT